MGEPSFDISADQADIERVVRTLRRAAASGLRSEVRKAIAQETKPVRTKMKMSARDQLPKRGGLNRWAARMPSAKTRMTGSEVGVSISLRRKGHDMRAIDRGRVRHPLFGNRRHWYTQPVTQGVFSSVFQNESDGVRRRVIVALDEYAARMIREGN